MKVLVVGGDGLLGKALVEELKVQDYDWHATTRRGGNFMLDLAQPKQWDVQFYHYSLVFIVAAVTKVVDCEAEPQRTWQINADGPVEVARRAAHNAAHVVFISSDAVERAPNLNYSRQKAYVESFVLAGGGLVVRPSRIPPDKARELAAQLIRLGTSQRRGLVRWSPVAATL